MERFPVPDAANDNQDKIVRLPVRERAAEELNQATFIAMRRFLAANRDAGEQPYLWSEMRRAEAALHVQHHSYDLAAGIINRSSEDAWRRAPAYYDALAAIIDGAHTSIQGEE